MTFLLAGLASTAFAGEVHFTGEGHAANPVWSRDGRHLAFEVNNYGDRSDLHVSTVAGDIAQDAKKVNLPGAGPFGGSQVLVNPTWHPQGLTVFEGSNAGGQFRLYFFQPGQGGANEMISTSEVPGDITFPAINKDGSQMAFIADRTGQGDINTRDTATTTIEIKHKSPTPEVFPQYSDDGGKILYTRKHNNAEDVFELSMTSGAETPVAGGGHDQSRPTYAAGGRVLFFDNSRDSQSWDLAMVAGAGGTKKVLAKDIRLPLRSRPMTSPDGKWVAFTYEDPTKANSVFVMATDGSRTVEVPTPYTACGEPSIGMQGGKALLAYTALPQSGADFRRLFVVDITGKL